MTPAALAAELLDRLRAQENPANVAGMARYGINPDRALGITVTTLRGIARELRTERRERPERVHEVAGRLWASGVHEARILAVLLDVPGLVTPGQAEVWVADLDSWDLCDQLQHLVAATPFAHEKAVAWARREETFVRRAGFVLMATLAVHDKAAPDAALVAFLPLVEEAATDERPMVRKGVNWALRQIGKRSAPCHGAAVACAERVLADTQGSAAARWVARDALRELRGPAVLARVAARPGTQSGS